MPIPRVRYTDAEQGVWRRVSAELAAKHERLACAECRDALAAVALPADRSLVARGHVEPPAAKYTASVRTAASRHE